MEGDLPLPGLRPRWPRFPELVLAEGKGMYGTTFMSGLCCGR
jgi:hypothetical protein